MTKFEIKTDRFEFRFGTSKDSIPAMTADEVFDAYMAESANDPTTEASFDTLEEAKAEFGKHYANYGSTHAEKGGVFYLLRGEIAWIEENEYDEDGEFDQGGCTYDVSADGYEVEDSNISGEYFDEAVELMDDEIREDIHNSGEFDNDPAGFLREYERRHFEKYGEKFSV